jgi:hypothetical protein
MARPKKNASAELENTQNEEVVSTEVTETVETVVNEIEEEKEEDVQISEILPSQPAVQARQTESLPIYELVERDGFRATLLKIMDDAAKQAAALGNDSEYLSINRFLMAFRPPVAGNTAQAWQLQTVMKSYKYELQKMVDEKVIQILNNNHQYLGKAVFSESAEAKPTRYAHLGDVEILAKVL